MLGDAKEGIGNVVEYNMIETSLVGQIIVLTTAKYDMTDDNKSLQSAKCVISEYNQAFMFVSIYIYI